MARHRETVSPDLTTGRGHSRLGTKPISGGSRPLMSKFGQGTRAAGGVLSVLREQERNRKQFLAHGVSPADHPATCDRSHSWLGTKPIFLWFQLEGDAHPTRNPQSYNIRLPPQLNGVTSIAYRNEANFAQRAGGGAAWSKKSPSRAIKASPPIATTLAWPAPGTSSIWAGWGRGVGDGAGVGDGGDLVVGSVQDQDPCVDLCGGFNRPRGVEGNSGQGSGSEEDQEGEEGRGWGFGGGGGRRRRRV